MRNVIRLLFLSFSIMIFLIGCSSKEVDEKENLFQYKNSYVGDAGAVGNITRQLPNPNGEQLNGLELKTTDEPYGIILNYIETENDEEIETNYKELALYNATFIFSLVQNADWVKFNFLSGELQVNRDELERFYGKDVREFSDDEELSTFIQKELEDDQAVIQFFEANNGQAPE